MTKVINLVGGSGLGKSTTAAGLFYEMKLRGMDVELVREYVKSWAWQGKKVGPYDQIYLLGKQAKAEYDLYGKVDYIVTDSPLLLGAVYSEFYGNDSSFKNTVFDVLNKAKSNKVEHINIVLERHKPFNPKGRYETEEIAIKVDEKVRSFLEENKIPYQVISVPDDERVNNILTLLSLI